MKYLKQLVGLILGVYIILMFQLLFLQSIFSFQKSIPTSVLMVNASTQSRQYEKNTTVLGIASESQLKNTPVPTITNTPTPTPTPVGDPVRLKIPALTIDTNIVLVGISNENVMETPTDFSTVGWFTGSKKPGEEGVAILTAHFDDIYGSPAIFYSLSKLKKGDAIIIETNLQQTLTFIVDSTINEPYKTFPKDLLYSSFVGRGIRLITCDGIWDKFEKTYSRRLVVTATL